MRFSIQGRLELSSLLLNIKQEAQAAIAVPLRAAIWNWIDLFPEEFNDIMRHHRRMDGAPERVFDILYDSQEATHNPNVWPTLIALACISPERMKKSDFQPNSIGMPIYKGHQNRRVCLIVWMFYMRWLDCELRTVHCSRL